MKYNLLVITAIIPEVKLFMLSFPEHFNIFTLSLLNKETNSHSSPSVNTKLGRKLWEQHRISPICSVMYCFCASLFTSPNISNPKHTENPRVLLKHLSEWLWRTSEFLSTGTNKQECSDYVSHSGKSIHNYYIKETQRKTLSSTALHLDLVSRQTTCVPN